MPSLLLLAACGLENMFNGKDDARGFDTGSPFSDLDSDSAFGSGGGDTGAAECPELVVGTAGTRAIDPDCEGEGLPTVVDPWDVVDELYVHEAGGAQMTIGNLTDDDGDGDVDEHDVPDIVYSDPDLAVLSGDGSGPVFSRRGFMQAAGTLLADVDADGTPEIVAIRNDARVEALDGTGASRWVSDQTVGWYVEMTVGDLDQDGLPEVVVDDEVFNGEDGTHAFGLLASPNDIMRSPVVADVDGDGPEEILLGAALFEADGTLRWDHSTVSGYSAYGALLNVDTDDEAEIVVIDGDVATVYEADGTPFSSFAIDAPYGYSGPPCVADFDGDGAPEIAIPQSEHLSVYEADGTELWSQPTIDLSGAAGCSGFDLDADGVYEVLYADEENFTIFDGATGAVRYQDPRHASITWIEYPLVADVDGDGAAEILVPEGMGAETGVRIYRHAGDGWPHSGPAWPVHDFAVNNVELDGTVPHPRVAPWLAYNLFRARPPVDDMPRANLRVSITDVCIADCDAGPAEVAVQVANDGPVDVAEGHALALYAVSGASERLVATATLPAVPAGTELDGVIFALGADGIGTDGYRAAVDDDGTGHGRLFECDEADNTDTWVDVSCR